ncbi:hypothetical protein [Corallococcus exiguus]|uniref:Uncharacterized protein n=1 Tax=Corallococcus exiguus TaxID=83462 RepID=A0A7X5BXQ4_9BACT|nr:hypothetical protein [Corallococcus exiguus]NBC45388.1 hypothetical protein [Corallococcus exiguus]
MLVRPRPGFFRPRRLIEDGRFDSVEGLFCSRCAQGLDDQDIHLDDIAWDTFGASHLHGDPLRSCRSRQLASGPNPLPGEHDALGSVVRMPTRTGTRLLGDSPSGALRSISELNGTATFRYGALGARRSSTSSSSGRSELAWRGLPGFHHQAARGSTCA